MREALNNQIKEKFDSNAAFGLAVGWIPQKVYRMLNDQYTPKVNEAVRISQVLGVSLDEVASFFTQ